MPETRDKDFIRQTLSTEREWSAYAIGDLEPALFEKCSWLVADGDTPAIALLFRAFDTPVLFTHGEQPAIGKVLDEIAHENRVFLSVKADVLQLLENSYAINDKQLMLRMVHRRSNKNPPTEYSATRLSLEDIEELEFLYADGISTKEAPDFFAEYMVEQGSFFGVFEGEELLAAAGTHLIAPAESVAAIGCVYTRRDCRGRGLASIVTGAVTADLLSREIETIVLNVKATNAGAIKVYERLGFEKYCEFYEGIAAKSPNCD